MLTFIQQALKKIYAQFTTRAQQLFGRSTIDEATLQELETVLIASDTGVTTTRFVIECIRKQYKSGDLKAGSDLKKALHDELLRILTQVAAKKEGTLYAQVPDISNKKSTIYLLVGINGSGKTTFAGKLAHSLIQQKYRVMLVAADTFRAAAVEQLMLWGERAHVPVVRGKPDQDPASVVFAGCQEFKKMETDVATNSVDTPAALIIDTAGRLQTKTHLMQELAKIKRTLEKQLPGRTVCTLLTIDAMLGQNSFDQAALFNECVALDGIVLTKMDGSGKGGIIFNIAHTLGLPVLFMSFGENIDALQHFDPKNYIDELLA